MTISYVTGEVVDAPSYAEVRESIETTKSHLERAAEQVVWQIESQAWTVLGYSSWDEMREAEYRGAAVIVPAADRPELSQRLRSTGMTHRDIAETIGVSESTVRNDNRNSAVTPPTVTDSLGRQRPTNYTPKTSTPVAPEAQARETSAISQADVEAAPMVGADDSPQEVAANAAPPVAEPDAVGEYLEGSQELQDAEYLTNFYKAISKTSEYRAFDADRIARLANADDIKTLELEAKYADEFLKKVQRARSGLRVITGGRA